jgi:hypothetical protein
MRWKGYGRKQSGFISDTWKCVGWNWGQEILVTVRNLLTEIQKCYPFVLCSSTSYCTLMPDFYMWCRKIYWNLYLIKIPFPVIITYLLANLKKENEMGGTYSMYGGRRKIASGFWWGNLKDRDCLKDLHIIWRIILRWLLEKLDSWMWTGFI